MLARLQTIGLLGCFFHCDRVVVHSLLGRNPNLVSRQTTTPVASSCLAMSTTTTGSSGGGDDTRRIKVLALHGSGSDARSFESVLNEFKETAFFSHGLDLDITAIDAPVEKDKGYAWWSMPPSVRSFNAKEYTGFHVSSEKVIQTIKEADPPFDLVFGHSQGAILTTALLALEKIPSHPPIGYILNGGAWPNPYTKELESLSVSNECRVLLVMGDTDTINAPPQQERVQKALEDAGCEVSVIRHPAGHSVPTKNAQAVALINEWMAHGAKSPQT
mmetsp:Transcript_11379/g.21726  ORF Transcript_11379/g.21726 Transcript_11379/m.21726 type:complete len:274 (+) Transcript_11379:89-910(+)